MRERADDEQPNVRIPRYLQTDPNRLWPPDCEVPGLRAAAKWAARRVLINEIDLDEREDAAMFRIVCDYRKIHESTNPAALARHIAKQHLQSVRRHERARSDSPRSEDDVWRKPSLSARLEYVDGADKCNEWCRTERLSRLHAAIDTFEEVDRRIIKLFFGLGEDREPKSVEQISKELGLATSSVYRRKQVALKRLEDLRIL